MDDPGRLPGARDVRVTLEGDDNHRVVVALPPHPQMGGDRRDSRLRAVSDALTDAAVDCLRIDYGPWDEGVGERTDAITALEWATDRYEQVGLFGYSFGGAVALFAATEVETANNLEDVQTVAVSALAPAAGSVAGFDPEDIDRIQCPGQVIFGDRDDTADWQSVVERARELRWHVESISADHFFVSQQTRVADLVTSFFATQLS